MSIRDVIEQTEPAEIPHTLESLGASDRARLTAALRDGWRLTPATFGYKITGGRWIPAPHLLYLSTIIATEIRKGGARIILSMPPRHGKSELLSVNTSAWFLEQWPNKFVMSISYGLELATDFSLKVRDTFQNPDNHHLLRTRIRQDKKRLDRWLTPKGGGLTAAGIGGPVTGRGADLMLIDDYVKNAEAALSTTQNDSTWEWFKSTAFTRLEPLASLVIIATRWGQRDLIGRCLAEMPGENWRVINLPALAELNDPLGRAVGEPLWPERYSREDLLKIKEALGTYWWEAMYQQKPLASMAGMNLGDKIKIIRPDAIPHHSRLKKVRTWDLAATEGGGDFTAGPLLCRDSETGRYIILDLQHFQKGPFGTEMMVSTTAESDGHGVPIWMEQETGSSGKIAIEGYSTLLSAYSFHGERATGPNEVRAGPFLAKCEAGFVDMVAADWNQKVIDEINAFPDGEHDDIVVALALGFNKLTKGLKGGLTWGRLTGQERASTRSRTARAAQRRAPQDGRRQRLTWGRNG